MIGAKAWDSPLALLVVTGATLGVLFPIGKVALQAGVPALFWAFVISLGTGAALLAALLARGELPRTDTHRLRYFAIVGLVSYAGPNLLVFTLIPHLGAGATGVMFTLSPLFTLLFSWALRMRGLNLLALAGILAGLAGALAITLARDGAPAASDLRYAALGLLIPASLGVGNVYRTLDWPPGAKPVELAAGSHLAAAVLLALAMLATGTGFAWGTLTAIPTLTAFQLAASVVMFVFYFRLQQVGGPLYLSQISYVAAAVGLAAGIALLGERYGLIAWTGVAVIVVGVAMTTVALRRARA